MLFLLAEVAAVVCVVNIRRTLTVRSTKCFVVVQIRSTWDIISNVSWLTYPGYRISTKHHYRVDHALTRSDP